MFGDVPIIGKSEVNVDPKGRIFVPAYTKREKGETLVLCKDNDLDVYVIYSSKKIEEILETIDKKIENSKTDEERIRYKKERLEILKSIIKMANLDKQNRMLIGLEFKEYEKVLTIGNYDSLIIEPIK